MSLFTIDQAKVAELRNEQIAAQRRTAYEQEADPLFFKHQRGQATKEEWLAKIEEIKARFPEVAAQ